MKIRGCHSIFSVGLLGHDTSFLNICNSVSIVREIDMAICGSSDLVQNCGWEGHCFTETIHMTREQNEAES